ncbi:MAG: PIN domain-containing protein [Caldithrix sp.]|nr:PIN domain-containing protein [Caldithrix sp.]
MNLFFDSSAWAKRYIEESGSDRVEDFCRQAHSVSLSILCVPEVISAFARLKRQNMITRAQFDQAKKALFKEIEDIRLINITPDVISHSVTLLQRYHLRTLDALHLACAAESNMDHFITSDIRQKEAATQYGFDVIWV